MNSTYRNMARNALSRAKLNMDANDDEQLQYAALDLRMGLEALTYELAERLKDDIPPEEYGKWQPPNLVKMLASIDPTVGHDSTLTIRREQSMDGGTDHRAVVGLETALSVAILDNHYHALGSYLHIPTINKLQTNQDHRNKRLRLRCEKVAAHISSVLNCSVWNIDFKNTSTTSCIRCNKTMVRRRNTDNEEQVTGCWNCGARYKLVDRPGKKVEWVPDEVSFNCPNDTCVTPHYFWRDEVKVGASWVCDDCGQKWVFAFGVSPDNGQPLYTPGS